MPAPFEYWIYWSNNFYILCSSSLYAHQWYYRRRNVWNWWYTHGCHKLCFLSRKFSYIAHTSMHFIYRPFPMPICCTIQSKLFYIYLLSAKSIFFLSTAFFRFSSFEVKVIYILVYGIFWQKLELKYFVIELVEMFSNMFNAFILWLIYIQIRLARHQGILLKIFWIFFSASIRTIWRIFNIVSNVEKHKFNINRARKSYIYFQNYFNVWYVVCHFYLQFKYFIGNFSKISNE